MRSIDGSLRTFAELFGNADTKDLKASDFKLFFDLLRRKTRKRKNGDGEHAVVTDAYVHKVMRHMRAYVRRLAERLYINGLTPAEVPNVKQPRKFPEYLTKHEL